MMHAHKPGPIELEMLALARARRARFSSAGLTTAMPKPVVAPVEPAAPEPQKPQEFYIVAPETNPCWIAIDGSGGEPMMVKRKLRISDVMRIVCEHYGLTREDLVSAGRTLPVVRPRQVAVYLCREMIKASYPEIARRFGGRDHTTAIASVERIKLLMKADTDFAAAVSNLRREVEVRCA